jgi:hypothetical protein
MDEHRIESIHCVHISSFVKSPKIGARDHGKVPKWLTLLMQKHRVKHDAKYTYQHSQA